jgi:Protein of unknown function (DUF3662)/FHA domain
LRQTGTDTTLGFFDSFEKGLERTINRAFSKTFKSELQPIEIASRIKSEIDAKASVISRERILVPTAFEVRLSSPDFKRMQVLGQPLISELTELAESHIKKQRFQMTGALSISLVEDSSLAIGQLVIRSSNKSAEVSWAAVLDVAGRRHPLEKGRTSVGRDASAGLQINDASLSRQHFEIIWDGKLAGLRDLGSTNGTRVDGQPLQANAVVALANESLVVAGRSQFVFRIVANAVNR